MSVPLFTENCIEISKIHGINTNNVDDDAKGWRQSTVLTNSDDEIDRGFNPPGYSTMISNAAPEPKPRKPRFACDECSETFTWSCDLASHKTTHKGASFRCEPCDKEYRCEASLGLHNKRGVHVQNFPCEKILSSKVDLENHVSKSHSMENAEKCICRFCDKAIDGSDKLGKHERIHDGALLKECGFCKKDFDEDEWESHEKVHDSKS